MAEKTSPVHVEIFGQGYAVQAGTEPGYVEQLAAFVDAQMREVSRGAGAVDSVRIAVLAALNIADELFQARARLRGIDEQVRRRAEGLARELSLAMGE
ncbi:MAG TPA: cell division protein ZapA [Vicinamibacteria bacterium]|nr:cell division protein ZapA [Vicinamibacteria bacterium]